MTSRAFWSDACDHARVRPLQTKLAAAYSSCGVTLRRALLLFVALRAPRLFVALRAPRLFVTCRWADRTHLRERTGWRNNVLPVVAQWEGGLRARVVAVRMVQRAHDVRQLRQRHVVGGADDVSRECI